MLEKLHLIDRFVLLTLIPTQGNWAQNKVWAEVRAKLDFTSEEVMDHGLLLSASGLQWASEINCKLDENGEEIKGTGTPQNLLLREDEPIETPISDREIKVCKFSASLKKLARNNSLLGVQCFLYEELIGPAPVDLDFLAAEAEAEEAAADKAFEDANEEDDE